MSDHRRYRAATRAIVLCGVLMLTMGVLETHPTAERRLNQAERDMLRDEATRRDANGVPRNPELHEARQVFEGHRADTETANRRGEALKREIESQTHNGSAQLRQRDVLRQFVRDLTPRALEARLSGDANRERDLNDEIRRSQTEIAQIEDDLISADPRNRERIENLKAAERAFDGSKSEMDLAADRYRTAQGNFLRRREANARGRPPGPPVRPLDLGGNGRARPEYFRPPPPGQLPSRPPQVARRPPANGRPAPQVALRRPDGAPWNI